MVRKEVEAGTLIRLGKLPGALLDVGWRVFLDAGERMVLCCVFSGAKAIVMEDSDPDSPGRLKILTGYGKGFLKGEYIWEYWEVADEI